MKMIVLQHAEMDSPGTLAEWAAQRSDLEFQVLRLDHGEPLPALNAFDWLVSLGGPMNADEDALYPWLAPEKTLVRSVIADGKRVLGICLGAQIMARALGSSVTRNRHTEIGWFPIHTTPEGAADPLFASFPASTTVFHWHGDTFETPAGAARVAKSDGCANQAFTMGTRVVALQFHIETGPDEVRRFIESGVPAPGHYIQTPEQMIDGAAAHAGTNRLLLFRILDRMAL